MTTNKQRVTVATRQRLPYDEYSGNGKCDWNVYNDGHSERDWSYNPNLCSRIDPNICPKIGTVPDIMWDTYAGPPNVICSYPLSVFSSYTNINAYVNNWGKDENYNHDIMSYFCSQQSDMCPENIDGRPFSSCNRLSSFTTEGELCREWRNKNPSVASLMIKKYCSEHDTEDCSCINDKQFCESDSYLHLETEKKENRKKRKCGKRQSSYITAIVFLLLLLFIIIVAGLIAWLAMYTHKTSRPLSSMLPL